MTDTSKPQPAYPYGTGKPKCHECSVRYELLRINPDTYRCSECQREYAVPEAVKLQEAGVQPLFTE